MRKAAYQLIGTLYDKDFLNLIDVDRLINELATNGLSDSFDEILFLNLVTLTKLTNQNSLAILNKVDQFVQLFTKLLTDEKKRQEFIK